MNIYFGNLSFNVDENDIRQILESYGEVVSISIHEDKYSGRPRRFAFVTMLQSTAAQTAVETLNGAHLKGLAMRVMKSDSPVKAMPTAL